jgi:hypothetical protein
MRQRSVVLPVALTLLLAVPSCQQKSYGQSNPSAKPKAAKAGTAQSHVLNVDVKLDAGHAAAQRIPVEGGTLSATAADGTRYTLTLPKDALLKDVTVTMTPVSLINGLHLSGKTVAAVHLAPEGLGLFKPATLLVEPGTPVPLKEQISFAFEGSGQKLHLYPLTKDPKIVAFDIMHFSGYGMGQGSAADAQSLSSVSQNSPEDQFLAALTQMGKDIRNMGDPKDLSEAQAQKELDQEEQDEKVVQEKYDEWGKLVIFPDLQAAEKRVLSCEELDRLAKQTFSWIAWMIKGAVKYDEDTEDAAENSLGRSILNTYDKAAADCNLDCMYRSVGMAIKGIGGKVAEKLAIESQEFDAALAKCTGNLVGTVTVVSEKEASGKTPDGIAFSSSSSLHLACLLDGTGKSAKCKETWSSALTGNGTSLKQSGNGDADVVILAAVIGGKTKLNVGMFTIKVKQTADLGLGPVEGTTDMQFGPWDAEGGAASPGRSSGTWSDGAGTTITWNLSGVM